jgi:diguanylate cyclase (GGDEF)-like protein
MRLSQIGNGILLKRLGEEKLFLFLTVFALIVISIFAVIRALKAEWIMFLIDATFGVVVLLVWIYQYRTGNIEIPKIALSLLSSIIATASVYFNGMESIYWVYPAIAAIFYLLTAKVALGSSLILVVCLLPKLFLEADVLVSLSIAATLFMCSFFGFFFSNSIETQHRLLEDLATKDSLTGVGNRRAMDEVLASTVRSQARVPSKVSLILLDLDYFKAINDEFGHMKGDQILIEFAKLISERIRQTDAFFRFGGEEFVIVPLPMDLASATLLAEKLRVLTENTPIVDSRVLTMSLGVAEYIAGETPEKWLHRADQALYLAKKYGRNCVKAASEPI